jgi:hypothetical protein
MSTISKRGSSRSMATHGHANRADHGVRGWSTRAGPDVGTDRAFVACDADVVECQRMVIAERLTTEEGAHTTAFDAGRQLVYVFLPRSQRAVVYHESDDV